MTGKEELAIWEQLHPDKKSTKKGFCNHNRYNQEAIFPRCWDCGAVYDPFISDWRTS